MEWFLYAIGFLWLLLGTCYILFTGPCRFILTKLLEHANSRFIAILAAIIGLLLFIAAPQTSNPWFFAFLGSLAILKGLVFWFNPKKIFEKIMHWYLHEASELTYRFWGIIMLILGAVVLFLM